MCQRGFVPDAAFLLLFLYGPLYLAQEADSPKGTQYRGMKGTGGIAFTCV